MTTAWSTKAELAEHFSTSRQTVERWMAEGMPYLRVSDGPRGGVRFRIVECEDWLRNRNAPRVHSGVDHD